jgi:hypothetical protein
MGLLAGIGEHHVGTFDRQVVLGRKDTDRFRDIESQGRDNVAAPIGVIILGGRLARRSRPDNL